VTENGGTEILEQGKTKKVTENGRKEILEQVKP
jgi:hypothetical protein